MVLSRSPREVGEEVALLPDRGLARVELVGRGMTRPEDVADYDEIVQVAELTLQLYLEGGGGAHPRSFFAGGRSKAFTVEVRQI